MKNIINFVKSLFEPYKFTIYKDDNEAIESDWNKVGEDFDKTIKDYKFMNDMMDRV